MFRIGLFAVVLAVGGQATLPPGGEEQGPSSPLTRLECEDEVCGLDIPAGTYTGVAPGCGSLSTLAALSMALVEITHTLLTGDDHPFLCEYSCPPEEKCDKLAWFDAEGADVGSFGYDVACNPGTIFGAVNLTVVVLTIPENNGLGCIGCSDCRPPQ